MSEASPRYLLTLDDDERPGVVEFWSETRLPFEPNAGVKDMRGALRSAVRRLRADTDELLEATYASPVVDFCDAENILFYNVGAGYFASASRNGVRFQRVMVVPASPESLEWRPNHYHRYEIRRRVNDWLSARKLAVLAAWRDVAVPRLSESTSASVVWWAMPPTTAGQSAPDEFVWHPVKHLRARGDGGEHMRNH